VTAQELASLMLELWTKTRIPLSEELLERASGESQRQLRRHLKALVADGTITRSSDAFEVVGVARSATGPETLGEWQHKVALLEEARARIRRRRGLEPEADAAVESRAGDKRNSVVGPSVELEAADDESQETGLALHRKALGLAGSALGALDKPRGARGKKSLKVSAGLSLLGPVGWLYAGSFKETIPAILLAVAVGAVLPNFMLFPFLWVAIPGSALAGLIYAWQYNRKGHRTPLLLEDKNAEKKGEDG